MRAKMADQGLVSGTPSAVCIAGVCASEILGLAGFSIVPALLPQIMYAWSLDSTQGGWLSGIISGGYMPGVIPLVAATDRVPARTVYLGSAGLSMVSSFGVALSDGLAAAMLFRALTGPGLAGMYMPGLRSLTDRMEGPRRARVAALYTSSFTIGTALSFLLGRAGIVWGWRAAFIVAGIAGFAGLLTAWLTLPRSTLASSPIKRGYPLRAVLRNRNALVLVVGYAASIWGAVGVRAWIVVFLGFCAGDPTRTDWGMLAVAALINLLGVPAGLWGNELAIRWGLRRVAILVFLATAIVTALLGFAGLLSFIAAAVAAIAVGFISQGNFSNLTSGLIEVAVPQYAGATMALYSCIGFAGGFLGTVLFGFTLDSFGGAGQLGAWIGGFGTAAIACLIGAAATTLLPHDIGRKVDRT